MKIILKRKNFFQRTYLNHFSHTHFWAGAVSNEKVNQYSSPKRKLHNINLLIIMATALVPGEQQKP